MLIEAKIMEVAKRTRMKTCLVKLKEPIRKIVVGIHGKIQVLIIIAAKMDGIPKKSAVLMSTCFLKNERPAPTREVVPTTNKE